MCVSDRRRNQILIVVLLVVALAATGCGGPSIEYISEGREYSLEGVDDLRTQIGAPDYGEDSASRATELRHDRLVELRSRSAQAATAADLLTQQFPNESRAVPYYVESASVDGTQAWIVLEVVASTETGRLDRVRLWVFDKKSGDVLRASSFN